VDAIDIVGAGGIGCALGYALATAGVQVRFVEANPRKVDWGKHHGVRVDERPAQPATFISFEDWMPRPAVPVLLCTKSYDNPTVLARLPSGITLMPVQNGFDATLTSRGEYPEGIASFVSECLPDRPHTRITRRGRLHLGVHFAAGEQAPASKNGSGSSQTSSTLAARLRSAGCFRVEVVGDILPYKHTKLMYNAAIGPLAALGGLDNGDLLAIPYARRLFFDLLRENYRILHDANVPLAKIGPFHPDTVHQILRRPLVARALSWAFYPSLRGTYCSMHGDLPAGRTEIEHYNGYLIALAGERPCPLNRRIYGLVRQMQADHTAPGLAVLERI
jgi:2-dehydropantoate 2-reductase